MRWRPCLNITWIKWLAIVTMLIDHIGAVFFPQQIAWRIVGRLSFPLFSFLIVEGMRHTHDWKKYMLRLGIFAVVSELPFDLLLPWFFYGAAGVNLGLHLDWSGQNVGFTLFVGALIVHLAMVSDGEVAQNRFGPASWLTLAALLAGGALSHFANFDYGLEGVLLIYLLYLARGRVLFQTLVLVLVNVLMMGGLQMYAVAAIVPIALYNGQPGRRRPKTETTTDAAVSAGWWRRVWASVCFWCRKYWFYAIYPLHLIVLYLIKTA